MNVISLKELGHCEHSLLLDGDFSLFHDPAVNVELHPHLDIDLDGFVATSRYVYNVI